MQFLPGIFNGPSREFNPINLPALLAGFIQKESGRTADIKEPPAFFIFGQMFQDPSVSSPAARLFFDIFLVLHRNITVKDPLDIRTGMKGRKSALTAGNDPQSPAGIMF